MKKCVLVVLSAALMILSLAGCFLSETSDDPLLQSGDGTPTAEIKYGDIITLQSNTWRKYLSNQNNASVEMAWRPLTWEQWQILDSNGKASGTAVLFNDTVVLKSVHFGESYLSARGAGDNAAVEMARKPLSWEKWTIVNARATQQPSATVMPHHTIGLRSGHWGNYLSGRGKGDGSKEQLMSKLSTWEEWVVMPPDYLGNWMHKTPEIHGKLLREITFPASHDAGTWKFERDISPEPEAKILRLLQEAPGKLFDLLPSWLHVKLKRPEVLNLTTSIIYPAIRGLSMATENPVGQQLNDGIRWLDLRVYLKQDGSAYTHHMLTGVNMSEILSSLRAFLESRPGEIVFVEMSHFIEDESLAPQPAFDRFASNVYEQLGNYAYKKAFQGNSISNRPLDQKYEDIFDPDNSVGTNHSKVVLIMDSGNDRSQFNDIFWNYDELTEKDMKIANQYANKSNREDMIRDQKAKFAEAKNNDRLFALYLTLTAQPDDCVVIVATDLVSAVLKLLGFPSYTPHVVISEASKAIWWALTQVVPGLPHEDITWDKDWTTLKELSGKISSDLDSILIGEFQTLTEPKNRISVIYGDYIERTLLVDTAIRYSRLGASTQ